MISFKDEIQKYKPALDVDDIESAIYEDEVKDVLDLLVSFAEKSAD